MKKTLVIIGVILIAGALGLGIYVATHPPKAADSGAKFATRHEGKPGKEDKNKSRKSTFYIKPKPEDVPLPMKGFYEWSQMKRLNEVTKYMEKKNLNPELLNFFKAELYNREHWDVTRNNMANALVNQENPDPELHEIFIQMLEDENEDPVWRDYCIQFLSSHLPYSSDKERVKKIIAEQSTGKTDRAGTAIVHLAYQEAEGQITLYKEFSDQIRKQLKDPEVTQATKLSILAVAGKRKDRRMHDIVREYAKQDANASLKRAAIGALGLMGDKSDIPLVQAALKHKNRAVVRAAEPALERLQAAAKTP